MVIEEFVFCIDIDTNKKYFILLWIEYYVHKFFSELKREAMLSDLRL